MFHPSRRRGIGSGDVVLWNSARGLTSSRICQPRDPPPIPAATTTTTARLNSRLLVRMPGRQCILPRRTRQCEPDAVERALPAAEIDIRTWTTQVSSRCCAPTLDRLDWLKRRR